MSFNDYLDFLKDSVTSLATYWDVIGHQHPYIEDIQKGLSHDDPFVLYKASIAATLLLEDQKIYH